MIRTITDPIKLMWSDFTVRAARVSHLRATPGWIPRVVVWLRCAARDSQTTTHLSKHTDLTAYSPKSCVWFHLTCGSKLLPTPPREAASEPPGEKKSRRDAGRRRSTILPLRVILLLKIRLSCGSSSCAPSFTSISVFLVQVWLRSRFPCCWCHAHKSTNVDFSFTKENVVLLTNTRGFLGEPSHKTATQSNPAWGEKPAWSPADALLQQTGPCLTRPPLSPSGCSQTCPTRWLQSPVLVVGRESGGTDVAAEGSERRSGRAVSQRRTVTCWRGGGGGGGAAQRERRSGPAHHGRRCFEPQVRSWRHSRQVFFFPFFLKTNFSYLKQKLHEILRFYLVLYSLDFFKKVVGLQFMLNCN